MITQTNRIDQLFSDRSTKKFIPFITVGDPTIELTEQIVYKLVEAGADCVELGIPYSDPLADGPTIQRASQRALAGRVSISVALQLVERLRNSGVTIPLVLFTYFNPVLQFGIERFFTKLSHAGVDGVVIPDLPFEENEEVVTAAKATGLHLISLVAPTSESRVSMIARQASGFVYCVSSLGVTGVRSSFHANVQPFLTQVRSHTDTPLAVGFGISSPEQVREFAPFADGIIVGSAIVQEIEQNIDLLLAPERREEGLNRIKTFVQNLAGALK
ncbi:tryptophan synthase subunit alpha [Brevibacillus ginsengisoli]|uniref:tryptophan synthase subunit alpha n=1 Tax=Brevibacillus ginsengisoli TaxID=363854 RepID=UPI003CE70C85